MGCIYFKYTYIGFRMDQIPFWFGNSYPVRIQDCKEAKYTGAVIRNAEQTKSYSIE